MRQFASAACALVTLLASASAQFVAVSYTGDVYVVDGSTGAASLSFSTGIQGLQGLTILDTGSDTGRLLAVQRANPGQPRIWELDTVLLSARSVHYTALDNAMDIAVSPSGLVYVVTLAGGVQCRLYTIDMSDPSGSPAVLVGDVKTAGQWVPVIGMTFAPNGVLYGWATSHGLVTVDPLTAQAVDVDGMLGATNELQDLAWAPDGYLYGGYSDWYRVDPATGTRTLLGALPAGSDVRGIEWHDAAAPERYCSPKHNSLGCFPAITISGSTSLSGPDDLTLGAVGELPQKPGLLLVGTAAQNLPFGGGVLCVGGVVHRTGGQVSGGTAPCDGTYSTVFSHAQMANQGFTAGSRAYFQWWSRDNGLAAPNNFALTDAIEVELLP